MFTWLSNLWAYFTTPRHSDFDIIAILQKLAKGLADLAFYTPTSVDDQLAAFVLFLTTNDLGKKLLYALFGDPNVQQLEGEERTAYIQSQINTLAPEGSVERIKLEKALKAGPVSLSWDTLLTYIPFVIRWLFTQVGLRKLETVDTEALAKLSVAPTEVDVAAKTTK